MMKITNGIDIFKVTKGAYEGIYKHQGYKPYGQEENASNEANIEPTVEPELTDDEIFILELEEKPIANWNKNEVKKYAELKGIDLTGTRNANEAKDIIKEFLQ